VSEHPLRRIGVLTGGGDCPGINAVIRAVVKRSILQYGWEVIGVEDGFEGLILPDRTRRLGLGDVRGILPLGGTILGTTNRANPFSYVTSTPQGGVETRDVSSEVVARIDALALDALVVIGGDGSLSIARDLCDIGVPIVGVPKTIDNDVGQTDVTFGFDTALDTATQAIDKLHTTAESHHRIMIVEVMGREAGWLALDAGLAGGADVILIPELPFRPEAIVRKIVAREREGALFSIVVVSEGARPVGAQAPGRDRQLAGRPDRVPDKARGAHHGAGARAAWRLAERV
jgi:6-phosphofructokinase